MAIGFVRIVRRLECGGWIGGDEVIEKFVKSLIWVCV